MKNSISIFLLIIITSCQSQQVIAYKKGTQIIVEEKKEPIEGLEFFDERGVKNTLLKRVEVLPNKWRWSTMVEYEGKKIRIWLTDDEVKNIMTK